MRERPLFAMAVSCVLGEVLAAFSLNNALPAVVLPAMGLQLFFVAAFFLWRAEKRRKNCVFCGCVLLGFFCGLLGYRNCGLEYQQDLLAYEGETVRLTGTVTYAEERETGVYYYLKNVTVYGQLTDTAQADESGTSGSGSGKNISGGSGEEGAPCSTAVAEYRKALVIDYGDGSTADSQGTETFDSAYYVGKRATVLVTYSAMKEAANPGNYDEKSYYESKGIGCKTILDSWESATGTELSVTNMLYRIRLSLHRCFYSLTDEKTAAFYCGMLLGEGYEISSEDKDIFRSGGIGHILAISGLHISLIGMAVYRILRLRLGNGTATAAGILLMVLYGSLTGGSPSALRAIAMFALRILAKKCGRRFDFLSAAGFSAFTILLAEPTYLFYSSFQLSFCAVFGAALAAPMVQKFLRVTGGIKSALLSGLVIQAVILPIQLYYFYQIAPYSLLLNLIVIPSMGVVLGAGILGVAVGSVWLFGGEIVLAAGGRILEAYAFFCEKTLALPGGLILTGAPTGTKIALYYGIFAVICGALKFAQVREKKDPDEEKKETHLLNIRAQAWRIVFPWFRGKRRRQKRVYEEKQMGPQMTFAKRLRRMCFLCFALTAAFLLLIAPDRSKLQVVFLDVGQGNGIFLESESGTTWLVDGGSSSVSEVGTYRILPFLKWKGVAKLDYMVLTHVDSDHYSGLLEILEQSRTGVRVGCLLVPDMSELDENYDVVVQTATDNDVPVYRLMTGVTWEEEGLRVACIWPDEDAAFEDTNEGSGVLYVSCGDFSMLLTGDIGEDTEKLLLANGAAPKQITVLGVPHHGSKYSSCAEFLSVLRPKIAIISAGENLYGHPSDETVARLAEAGADIYVTMDCGALSLETDGEELRIRGYKALYGRD